MHKKTVIDFKELGRRYIFENPLHELKAERLEEVGGVLEAVEAYQKEGCYVVGYLSYEAAAFLNPSLRPIKAPLFEEYLAYFTVHDKVRKEDFPLTYEQVAMPEDWQSQTDVAVYETAVRNIRQQIRQGNTYQVNYTIQLRQQIKEDSLAVYNRLVLEQEAAYNAYIAHDDVAILSISPELFFRKEGDKLVTRPMKGTVARGLTLEEDRQQAAWLQSDPKNRSENMMIVDLLRNDLGKVCQIGSVKVKALCQLEQYSTVWQMTSTVEGILEEGADLVSVFGALYPCGSITGAPKIATMSLINELEDKPRGVYCGAVGICMPEGRAVFNVPIRTLQLQGSQANYGVGSGITWDSSWQAEYDEVRQKSSVLYRQSPVFDLISSAKMSQGQIAFLEQHVERLQQSAAYFSYPFDSDRAKQEMTLLEQSYPEGDYRLRFSISKSGDFKIDVQPLTDLPSDFLRAKLVKRQQDFSQSPFTFFKTSHRPHLHSGEREEIYVSPEGYLLETSIGNLVLSIGGNLYTPPVNLGLLPGIYRQELIQKGQLTERVLTLQDLDQAEEIYGCNAVRGLYPLTVED